jgi:hypothetical protein
VVPEERLGGTDGKEVFAEKKGLSIFKDKVCMEELLPLCSACVMCAVATQVVWDFAEVNLQLLSHLSSNQGVG